VCHENENPRFFRTGAFYQCRTAMTCKMSPRTASMPSNSRV
jgi:hypothetical protein